LCRGWRRRIATAVSVAVACLSLASCTRVLGSVEQVDVTVLDVVWLSDGWIYFMRQASSDAPWEVWRRHPDGSGQTRFAAPTRSECPSSTFVFLFDGPHGGLGVGTGCPKAADTYLDEYSTDGQRSEALGSIPHAVGVTWRDGDRGGYAERIVGPCWGIVPLSGSSRVKLVGPVVLNGVKWSIDPSQENYACDGKGKAKSPVVTPDGDSLYFLASGETIDDPAEGRNSYRLSWQLCRWDSGQQQPTMVGPPLKGAGVVRLSDDNSHAAVSVHGTRNAVELIDLKSGVTKELLRGVDVVGFDLSPDGRSLVVATTSGGFQMSPVG
jgi:hypothetical protein